LGVSVAHKAATLVAGAVEAVAPPIHAVRSSDRLSCHLPAARRQDAVQASSGDGSSALKPAPSG
jgi:hypothetical protein